jgi:outer membrane receptor protein involved in Fe transport
MIRTISFGAILLGTTMLAAAPALAQAAEQPGAEQEGAAESDAEIVVTAQKIEQRAVDVPITISALTGERINAGRQRP